MKSMLINIALWNEMYSFVYMVSNEKQRQKLGQLFIINQKKGNCLLNSCQMRIAIGLYFSSSDRGSQYGSFYTVANKANSSVYIFNKHHYHITYFC